MTILKISAKEMNKKYNGARGGYITGTHYALVDEKGIISLDGKNAYILKGNSGKNALQSIINDGGFVGEVARVATI